MEKEAFPHKTFNLHEAWAEKSMAGLFEALWSGKTIEQYLETL